MDSEPGNNDMQAAQASEVNKFILRLPCEYHAHLTEISRLNRRSMNSEITLLVERHLSDIMARGLQSSVDSLRLNPATPQAADKLIEKLQELSLEKKKALLALLG